MLQQDLTLPILKETDHYLKKKIKNSNLTNKRLDGQIMKEFVGSRAKAYSYLKGNNDADKKNKRQKRCVTKRKLKFEDYKNCLAAAQIEKKKNI